MTTIAEMLALFETFPETGIADLLKGQTALIVAPHPDDESLGCGGLIAASCAAGLPPVVAVLTDGAASHAGSREYPPARLRALREIELWNAVSQLGLPPGNVAFLRYPDTELPNAGASFEDAVARIAEIATQAGCRLVVAPWAGDPHCDHQAAAVIGETIAAQSGLRLLSYPVWGWLRAATDTVSERRNHGWRLDISATLVVKKRAIAAHVSQFGGLIRDAPNGFCLPNALLDVFARPFEVFIE